MGVRKSINPKVSTAYYADFDPSWTTPKPIRCDLLDQVSKHLPTGSSFPCRTSIEQQECRAALVAAIQKAGLPVSTLDKIWSERIDPEFDEAVAKLAEWDPGLGEWNRDSWANHPDNPFFWYRDRLVDCAQSWKGYRWERETDIHAQVLAHAKEIRNAAESLADAIRALKGKQLLPEDEMQSIKSSRDGLRGWLKRPVWTDLFEWRVLPLRQHGQATMAAMMLADTLLRWRDRKNNPPSIYSPYHPQALDTSIALPWDALALFTEKAIGQSVDRQSLRTKALNVWPDVARYRWPFDNRASGK